MNRNWGGWVQIDRGGDEGSEKFPWAEGGKESPLVRRNNLPSQILRLLRHHLSISGRDGGGLRRGSLIKMAPFNFSPPREADTFLPLASYRGISTENSTGKQPLLSHLLHRAMEEWEALNNVRPLFAATLPWRVIDGPSRGYLSMAVEWLWQKQPGETKATEIRIETTLAQFKIDVATSPGRPPEGLPFQLYEEYQKDLSALLTTLETFIDERVIDTANRLSQAQPIQHNAPGLSPTTASDVSGWARNLPFLEAVSSLIGIQAEHPPRYGSTNGTSLTDVRYKKLECLGRIIKQSLLRGENIASSYRKFVILEQTLEKYQEVLDRFQVVNLCFNTIIEASSPEGRYKIRAAQRIPRTQWQNNAPWEISCRLFRMLSNKTCLGHQARLRLNGINLDDRGQFPALDVFLSSCPPFEPPIWQEGRYKFLLA